MQACTLLADVKSEHQQILKPSVPTHPVFKQNSIDSEDELYGLAVETPRHQDVHTTPKSKPKINLKASGRYMLGLLNHVHTYMMRNNLMF